MKLIALFLFSYLLISCETTSLQMGKKTIYEPKGNDEAVEEKQQRSIKDFSGIKDFEGKKISMLQDKFGVFDFSKIEKTFEFHRYNANHCRIFIQNYSSNKIIIHITIYDLNTGNVYDRYNKNLCS